MILIGIIFPFLESIAQIIEKEVEEEIQAVEEAEELSEEDEAELNFYDSVMDFSTENFENDLHKLLDGWYMNYFTNPEEYCADADVNPIFSDDVYRMRLSRMMTVIPMTYNQAVRASIDMYAGRYRKSLRFIMGIADFYFPIFEQILDNNDMPHELKYLSIVESALNPFALSPKGASGLWQLMLPAGKIHGLEINSLIDERFSPEKATEAACRYLKEMFNLFGDWHLAIAAYNCGGGGVQRAIRRAGGVRDFWKILPHLPRETRSFVPKFIAAAYIMTYHCEHNICSVRSRFSVVTDTIMVNQALHFDQVADILQIDKELVRFYNPQYKREIIPGNIRPSVLRLPLEKTFAFIEQEDSLYTHRMDELLAHCILVDPNNPKARQELIFHTVKVGENLNTIANLYGITAQNLRNWNGLSGSRVAPGRRLRVSIDNGGLTFGGQQTPATASVSSQKTDNTMYYEVQAGDTLSAIARKFPAGITVQSIQQANGMTTTNLRIGQVLKIQ